MPSATAGFAGGKELCRLLLAGRPARGAWFGKGEHHPPLPFNRNTLAHRGITGLKWAFQAGLKFLPSSSSSCRGH